MHALCEICGSPLDHHSNCDTPGCGEPGIPYEVWQRAIIDALWAKKWELTRIKPTPPLKEWYKAGKDPEHCAAYILTHPKLIKKPRKTMVDQRAKYDISSRKTKPASPPTSTPLSTGQKTSPPPPSSKPHKPPKPKSTYSPMATK